jgi:hypothetical protein
VASVRDSVAAVSGADDGLGWNRKSAALALLSFAMLTVSLDQYIVVVALPEIGRELGYSAQTLQSVISAYTVASCGFLLLGGRTQKGRPPLGALKMAHVRDEERSRQRPLSGSRQTGWWMSCSRSKIEPRRAT